MDKWQVAAERRKREIARLRAKDALAVIEMAQARGAPKRVLKLMLQTAERELLVAGGGDGEAIAVLERAVK